MTYFKIVMGYDCGVDKSVCKYGYPENCFNCLSEKFSEANFLIDINEAIEQQSEKKRKEILYKSIWRKYQDISTIRHVIIITRGGVPAFNMAIGDLPIDAILISGFIQANISFSSQELTLIDKLNPEKRIYEFEYKHFHILLCKGKLCSFCLILDKKASNNLRELLSNFTEIFEQNYEDEIKEFEEVCDLGIFDPVNSLIEKSFETYLNYPLILSSLIPPNVINDFSLVQKAIYECAKDLLRYEPFFFISFLLATTSKLLGVISNEEILWNIRQLMRENIILCQNLEFQKEDLKTTIREKQGKEHIFQEINDFENIILESQNMSFKDAQIKVNSFIKKGEIADANKAYQEALYEYQAGLNYAKEFNMEIKINDISNRILEIRKLSQDIELNFALKQANRSETKKDYIIALKYLYQVKDVLTADNDKGKHDKQLQKIDIKIKKIQKNFQ